MHTKWNKNIQPTSAGIDHHSTQNLPCILESKLGHYLTSLPSTISSRFNNTAFYVDVFVCDANVFAALW